MLPETRALLAQWDDGLTPQENLARALNENWLGKAPRTRAASVLSVFRQRYLRDPAIVPRYAPRTRAAGATEPRRRVVLPHREAERLLYDVATR